MTLTPALPDFWPWIALVAVPIGIVLLYFLKLRREPVEVPSTYLWTRTIEDLHVNSLLQRLRNSLLLFLQLLAVLLAALALFRPGFLEESSSLGRMVFLLDTSASMQAPAASDDDETPQSRFESARKQIEARIDRMSDSETAMLVTFSDRAEVMQAFTSDRNRLRDALARCEVTNRSTDVLGALRAADGLANPRRTSQIGDVNDVQVADALPAELLLFSDGGFQDVTEFSLGNLKPTYHAVGSTKTKNLAIASFSAQRDLQDPTQVEAFATIVNTGNTSLQAEASLFVDGELFDATTVQLDGEDRRDRENQPNTEAQPGTADQAGLSFKIEAVDAVRLRLELAVNDDLPLDNQAYAALTPSGLVSVLVITPGNRPVELGFSTAKAKQMAVCEFVSPDFMKTPAYVKRAAAGTDDLIVFDRCQPPKMPATNTFCIGALPNDTWSWTSDPASVTLIDIDRTHPILRYLEMYSLLVFSGRAIEGPKGTVDLVESDQGPVLSIASRDGYQDLVLGFELVSTDDEGQTQANTNWYAERSWPVFLLNVLRHLAGAAQSSGAPSYRPGETVLARLENVVSEVKLVRSDENDQEIAMGTLAVGAGGMAEVVQTALPGTYQLVTSDPDRVVDRFAINLFDAQESRLSTREDVEMGYETIAAADAGIETRREYWRWLLVIALAIVALEWWIYTRRLA